MNGQMASGLAAEAPEFPYSSERLLNRRDRNTALMIVLLLLGVYWFTMGGHTVSVDGEGYLAGTRALAHHTTVLSLGTDTDGVVSPVANKNGDPTIASPIGTLLLFLPGYLAGRIASSPFPVASQEEVLRLFFLAANAVMTAITGGLLFLLCRLLKASRRASALLAFAFGLGTWAWPHSQSDFSEPGTAMVLTAATLAAVLWWRTPTIRNSALVGLLAGSVVLTRSSTLLFVPIFLLFGLIRDRTDAGPSRRQQVLAFAIGGLGPALLFAVNAYIRFGSPFDNGYPDLSYSTPIYEGVFGLFLSAGKGLVWYAPVCIVSLFALRRTFLAQKRYTVFVGALLLAHLAVYARFQIWSGENAFGPRYLIPVLPLLVALIAPVIDSGREWFRGVKVAAAIGFLVPGLLGSTMHFNSVYIDNAFDVTKNMDSPGKLTSVQQHLAWEFQPRSSPLMLHVRSLPDLFNNTVDRLQGEPGGITPIPAEYESRIHWYTRAIELDFWWAWWSAKGLSRFGYIFLLAPVVCLGLGLRLLRKLVVTRSWSA